MNKRRSKKAYKKWLALKPLTKIEQRALSRYIWRYKIRNNDIPPKLQAAIDTTAKAASAFFSAILKSAEGLIVGVDTGTGQDRSVVVEVRKQLPVKNEPFSMEYKVVSR